MNNTTISEAAKVKACELANEAESTILGSDEAGTWEPSDCVLYGALGALALHIQTTSDVAKGLRDGCGYCADDTPWESLILPDPKDPLEEAWECFEDTAYYDMWCVRRVGEGRFGQGFHVPSKAEAETLRYLLSGKITFD